MNNYLRILWKKMAVASIGLFFAAFGIYLTIQANIGVAPWDTFTIGLSKTMGIQYGNASIMISLLLVAIDIAMREQIGIGMFLDAILVGKFIDLFQWLCLVPQQTKFPFSLLTMVAGMVIIGCSQASYMKAGLGCGPRDTLLVGLKRKCKKIPIGMVSVMIYATVTFFGWLLGGPIGVGTLLCAFLQGPIMQADFSLMHFDATAIRHQNILESWKALSKDVKY